MFTANSRRLIKEDYNQPCKELAVYLLGKILVRKLGNGSILKGKIVETECYIGGEDKASHSHMGKITKRNEPMYMAAGTAYVYVLYFGYHCFNISSEEPGAVVLLRALEPISGMNDMIDFRAIKYPKKKLKVTDLCNGPSKLCIAMNITKDNANKLDLTDLQNNHIWLEEDSVQHSDPVLINTLRVGIGASAKEWAMKPLRYYLFNNKCVSKRDKKAEKLQCDSDIM